MLLDRIEIWYEQSGKKLLSFLLSVFFIVGGSYIFVKYILELVAPFIVAWVFAMLLNPFVTWLHKRCKLPRGIGTIVSMATILSAFLGFITLVVKQLWIQIVDFSENFAGIQREVTLFIGRVEVQIENLSERFILPDALQSLDDVIKQVMTYIGGFLDEIVSGAYTVVSKVPNVLFFIIVVFIATFFMTKDHRKIKNFFKAQVPEKTINKIILIQRGLKEALGGYVKTQLILMCFTFSICLVGLFVLGRNYVLLVALGIAVLDALPVFGSGAILIPWGIYHLIMGDYALAIGLLSIYGIIIVIRQIMEPKVLSTQIGVYALVTLMAMYAGLKTMGVFGMILGPIIMVMIKTLQTIGILPGFKKSSKD